jgi:hypothetical protein
MRCPDPEDLFLAVVAFLAVFTGTCMVRSAAASGAPDYCYISAVATTSLIPGAPTSVVYSVIEHRPWSANATMLVTTSFQEVRETIDLTGCFLKPQQYEFAPVP